jgi:nicotinic acid mononucleotide adenylyltransferase
VGAIRGNQYDRRRMMGLDTFVGHITADEPSGGAKDEIKVVEHKKSDGIKKHVTYKVMGKDSQGDIEVWRRYKEFLKLRHFLNERWPGFYIPPLPPKKAIVILIY